MPLLTFFKKTKSNQHGNQNPVSTERISVWAIRDRLKSGVYWIRDTIRVEAPAVTEDFIPRGLLLHFQGRLALVGTTIVVLWLIPNPCPGGNRMAAVASAWTIFSFFYMCGIRFYVKKDAGLDINFGSAIGSKFVKRYSTYPAWSFIPDVLILTLMVIHTGAAFSLFMPMFLVLGILGDHTLILWPWRRLFLPLFIFLPYSLIIFLSTVYGKSLLLGYLPWLHHEAFWASDEPLGIRVAIFTGAIFVGATLLTSYVLRHLLLYAIRVSVQRETALITSVSPDDPDSEPKT